MEQDGATVDREKQEFGESYEKVQGSMLNAYPRRGSYSLRLSGSSQEVVGPGKVLHVLPGNKVMRINLLNFHYEKNINYPVSLFRILRFCLSAKF
jgi:hypothetical protein